jgi:hypothetical protein
MTTPEAYSSSQGRRLDNLTSGSVGGEAVQKRGEGRFERQSFPRWSQDRCKLSLSASHRDSSSSGIRAPHVQAIVTPMVTFFQDGQLGIQKYLGPLICVVDDCASSCEFTYVLIP